MREGIDRDIARLAMEKKQYHVHAHLAKLAPREREALVLLLDGHGNMEISKRMGIAYATAKQYKGNILLKMDASSMADVVEMMRLSPPNWQAAPEEEFRLN